MKKGKHQMNGADRWHIMGELMKGTPLRKIAQFLGRPIKTIVREILKHTHVSFKGCSGRKNQCVHRQECRKTGICVECKNRGHLCARCQFHNCNRICPEVEYIACEKRLQLPGKVCNGCPDLKQCHLRKFIYDARSAQEEYRRTLRESRQGAAISEEELVFLDGLFSEKIKKGQSIHHICVTNADQLSCHERTIQRYVADGLLSVKYGDLKRAGTLRKRKPRASEYQYKVDRKCHVGRTYTDYTRFLSEHPSISPVYMDVVIGKQGGACIMTLHWLTAAFMIGFLLPKKCAANVTEVFNRLYAELGHDLFVKLFPVILTDRGTEFSDPMHIEFSPDGTRRTHVFFCDPMNSNQKSELERNHEIVREILPKGTPFEFLNQDKVNLLFSHVNASVRLSHADRTPFELFEFLQGTGIAEKLHIAHIDPKEMILKPILVGLELK